uniref:Gustatory receptor n=1 Tax=Halyomorpha halys TaxID=286706 RepID=A0A1P8P1M8_HALHY|nr:gustatory and odorant receptor 24-like protein isoform X1 [Halyomorpha halys]
MKQGSMSKAWITTSVSHNKPYKKVPVKKYFQEIKPLILLQRAFGKLPYSFNEEGFAPFKLLSFPVIYTIIFIVFQSTWTVYSLCIIIQEKIHKAPSYDVTLYWVSIGLFLLLNFTTPMTKWIDIRKFVHHVSSWQDFQNNHLDAELGANLSLTLMIASVLLLPIASVFVYCQSYLLTDLSLFVMVPYIFSFVETGVIIIHWGVVLYELRIASRTLLSKIIMDGCRQMSTYRRTWLELSKLVSGVGESLGHTGLVISIVLFTTFVLAMYALLSSLFEPAKTCNHVWGLLINAVLSLLCNLFLFNAAHRTTQEVGPDFSCKILASDLTHLSQVEMNEISLMVQTISANPPTVEYLGFVTVNRSLFVSLVSNAVTYLVVLIQFKASAPEKPVKEEVVQ